MSVQKLTARTIASLKPRTTRFEVFDADTPGLALRVTPSRVKTWTLFYRQAGRLRRLTLGTHSEKFGLAEARIAALNARSDVSKLIDPAVEKAEAKLDAASTIAKLVEVYAADPVVTAKRSWTEEQRVLDKDILPAWGDRPVKAITRADVRALMNAKAAGTEDTKGAPVMANRLLAHVSHLFNYALDLDLLDANPAARLPKLPMTSRERVLTRDEVRALWRYVTKDEVPKDGKAPAWSEVMRDLFAVLLLTGQRLGEVAGMKWTDVDVRAGWWTLPATETKNKHQHRVPLSKPARAILTRRRPTSDEDVERQVYVFSTMPGSNIYARAKKAMAQLCGAFKWTNARAHDLRRTVATNLGELGIAPHVISAILNHTDGSITAVYNRFKYDAEKQAAIDKWAERIAAMAKATPADVVTIEARR
jgi:integrase